ncbi:MAG: hypothetical protein V1766_06385 [Pseudomonadota bacterium]
MEKDIEKRALSGLRIIDLVDILDRPCPIPAKECFIPLRFEDAGNGLFRAFLLAFSP